MAGTFPSLVTYPPSYYNEEPPEYMGIKTVYAGDGGADYRTFADTPIRRWTILYASSGHLIAAEAAVFSTLAANNKYSPKEGSLLGFDFTPRGEALIANVHFDEGGFTLRRGGKAHVYIIEIKLIKRV